MEHQKLTAGMAFALVMMVAILRPQIVEVAGSGAIIVFLAIVGVCFASGFKAELQRRH